MNLFGNDQEIRSMIRLAVVKIDSGYVDQSIELVADAFDMAKNINDNHLMVKAKGTMGYIGLEIGDYASAQINFFDAYTYLKKYKISDYYNETYYLESLAFINSVNGDYKRAVFLYDAAYKSAVNYIDKNREDAEYYGDLDWLYLLPLQQTKNLKELGEYEKAGNILFAVLDKTEFEGDDVTLAEVINQIGILKLENKEYLSAQDFFGRVAFSEDSINDATRAAALHNLGLAYFNQEDYNKAEQYYTGALELKKSIGAVPDKLFITLRDLGEVLYAQGKFKESIDLWNEAMASYDQFESNPETFKIYELLSGAYKALEDERAEKYSDLYIASMSSWIDQQTNKNANPELAVFNTKVDSIIAGRTANARRVSELTRYWPFAAMALVLLIFFVYQMQITLNKRRDRAFENRLRTDRAFKADEILKQIRRD